MGQRDIGSTSTYVNPTSDPMPAGFGGQGIVTTPVETGPPPGFNGGVTLPQISSEMRSALPEPPAGYKPGPLAPVRHEYEDSPLFKIGSVLASYGESVPVNLKIKLAQQESDLKLNENKLAWDNYYKNNEMVRSTLQQHSRAAMMDFLTVFPNIKAQISATVDPKQQQQLAEHWANSAEAMYPGGGKLVKFFHKNQSSVYSADAMLSDPDETVAGPAREIVKRMGYENAIQSKEWIQLSHIQNRDRVNSVAARMPLEVRQKLSAGKMDENEFRTIFKQTMLEHGQRPVTMAAAQAFLDTPQGQAQMVGLGVNTNEIMVAQEKKKKDAGLSGRLKEEDLVNTNAILEFDKTHPNVLPEQTVADARLRMDRHLGLAAKESSPGQFSENNSLSPFLLSASAGKFKDPDAMLGGAAPGSSEYTKRLGYLNEAIRLRSESNPMGSNAAKLDMLHDSNANPVYTMKDGKIVRQTGPLTEGQYRSMSNGFTMSSAQKEHLSKIDAAEIGGLQLLKQAENVYKGKTTTERAAEVLAENVLTSGPNLFTDQARAIAASKYPELAAYVARRDAVLGTYAKGLGGEAGVLTDQDIARVKKLFSGAYDTKGTRAAKLKAFQQIINLNRKALANTLTTNQGTDNEGQVSPSQWLDLQAQHSSTVNGILGSVEDIVRKAEPKESTVKSLAEPQTQTGSRGESLLEKMRKGK